MSLEGLNQGVVDTSSQEESRNGRPSWCSGSVMLSGTLAPSVFLLPISSVRPPFAWSLPGYKLSLPGYRLVASRLRAVTSCLWAGEPAPGSQVNCMQRKKKEASVEKDVEAFPEITSQRSSHMMAD